MLEKNTNEQIRSAAVERLFYVTLVVTVIHAGFILWDLGTMVFKIPNEVYASSLMNSLYLILIGGYAGFKEVKRWLSDYARSSATALASSDKIIQFERGEKIVYSWLGIFIVSVILFQLKVISRMPMELTKTAIQSITFLIATLGSRAVYNNKKAKEQARDPSTPLRMTDEEIKAKILEIAGKNGSISNDDVRDFTDGDRFKAHRLLLFSCGPGEVKEVRG